MSNLTSRPKNGVAFHPSQFTPAWICMGMGGLLLTAHFPVLLYFLIATVALCCRFPGAMNAIASHPQFQKLGGFKTLGVLTGALLFLSITLQGNPAMAQLFDQAETEVNNTFGQYLDGDIITFLFSLLRVVVWISAVGFVFFAVYQAQRGEQWQPLVQNAFIVIAAVVVVEGLSALFFGG